MGKTIAANHSQVNDIKKTFLTIGIAIAAVCCLGWGNADPVLAGSKTCGSFFLRNSEGDVINPLTGENADQPFSSRKTCGACHDYDVITKGFHFQQGWEKISDIYSEKMPWVLSDGMMGKH
jgi:hypothetical protein